MLVCRIRGSSHPTSLHALPQNRCTVSMALKTQQSKTKTVEIITLAADAKTRHLLAGMAWLQHIVDRSRVHVFGPWEVWLGRLGCLGQWG